MKHWLTALTEAIAQEESRLAQLEAERTAILARLILATGRYIGDGFDDARLDTLFLALPFSWKGMLVQYAGRLHRLHPGKEEVRIHAYVDGSVPMMLVKMHDKRMKGFRAIWYDQGEPETI